MMHGGRSSYPNASSSAWLGGGAQALTAAGAARFGELLQAHLPGADVVKAFNAILWTRLRDDGRPAGDGERVGIPISGDEEQAKQTVAELIDQIGFDAVDAGTLAEGGRKHQP
jgi:predicted dinucleotide-binding enzyme